MLYSEKTEEMESSALPMFDLKVSVDVFHVGDRLVPQQGVHAHH